MKKTYAFVTIFVLLFVLSASLLPGITFANHTCTGDPEVDAGIDSATSPSHACTPAGGNSGGAITTFSGLLGRISSIVDDIIPFIIWLAVFVIIWGIFNYLVRATDEEKRADARKYIVWGIIALFFMLSIWGFVNILLNTFSLKRTIDAADIPKVPRIGGTPGTAGDQPPDNRNVGDEDSELE